MVASKIVGYVRSAAASIVRCVLRNGVERASERKRESNLSPASLEKSKKGGEGDRVGDGVGGGTSGQNGSRDYTSADLSGVYCFHRGGRSAGGTSMP